MFETILNSASMTVRTEDHQRGISRALDVTAQLHGWMERVDYWQRQQHQRPCIPSWPRRRVQRNVTPFVDVESLKTTHDNIASESDQHPLSRLRGATIYNWLAWPLSFKRPSYCHTTCLSVCLPVGVSATLKLSDLGFVSNMEPIGKCLRCDDLWRHRWRHVTMTSYSWRHNIQSLRIRNLFPLFHKHKQLPTV